MPWTTYGVDERRVGDVDRAALEAFESMEALRSLPAPAVDADVTVWVPGVVDVPVVGVDAAAAPLLWI